MRLYIGVRYDRARSRNESDDAYLARSKLARATFASVPYWDISDYGTYRKDVPDEPKINKIKANSWFLAAIAYGLCLATWLFFIQKNNVIGIGQTFFFMSSALAVSTSIFGALLVRWSNISRQYRKLALDEGMAFHGTLVNEAQIRIRATERIQRAATPVQPVPARPVTYRMPDPPVAKTTRKKAKKIIAEEPEKAEGKGRFDLL